MPRTNRERLLVKHEQARNHVAKAQVDLSFLGQSYSASHPKQESMVRLFVDMLQEIEQQLVRFRQEMM